VNVYTERVEKFNDVLKLWRARQSQ